MTTPTSPLHRASNAVPGTPTSSTPNVSPTRVPVTLKPSPGKQSARPAKFFRVFRTVFRSFPIITPACRFQAHVSRGHIHGATRTTGTLFGHRKGYITLAIQESPRSVPLLLLELGIPTAKFLQEMGSGLLRLALECEKKRADKTKILEEPAWAAFINGRKIGCATKRDPTVTDLSVMQLLHAVSMGAGVLPGDLTDPADGELTYMRSHFDRVTGSRDSETFYMLNPDEKSGPELSVFFVRI